MAVTPPKVSAIRVHPRPRLTLGDIAAEPGGRLAIRKRITELHRQGLLVAASAVEVELRAWEAAQRGTPVHPIDASMPGPHRPVRPAARRSR